MVCCIEASHPYLNPPLLRGRKCRSERSKRMQFNVLYSSAPVRLEMKI